MRKFLSILCLLVVFSFILANTFPKVTQDKYVNDYVGILRNETKEKIVYLGRELEEKTTAQIFVVIIKTTEGMDIETYANQLFRIWGIGQKDKNNGVLLLVAFNDRKVRIEVGYGLEGRINDAKAGRILDNEFVPYFKDERYDDGIYRTYLSLVSEIAKEYGVSFEQVETFEKERESLEQEDQFTNVLSASLFVLLGIALLFLVMSRIAGSFSSPYMRGFSKYSGSFFDNTSSSSGGSSGGGSSGGGGASRGW